MSQFLLVENVQASLSVFALSPHTQVAKGQHKVKQGLRICNSLPPVDSQLIGSIPNYA
jgi:hypothetical protein